jgi:DNA polymerase I-like protein with 3'-5' exonuclease and polymerase domains
MDDDCIGFDIETLGFDPYTDRIVCIQIGNARAQFVIDTGTVDIQLFKEILETRTLIGHNLKFDIRFLLHQRIIPSRVFDTFLAEKTTHLGLESHRCSLAECTARYLGLIMDKTERGKIDGKFTYEFIIYSATDVAYLHELKKIQEKKIQELGCAVSIELDNKFVIVLSYIEYCGMKLDVSKWMNRLERIKQESDHHLSILEDFVTKNYRKFVEEQIDMFQTKVRTKINWNSAAQVIKLFTLMGVDTEVIVDGQVKHTTESSQLVPQIDKFPILDTYIKYKECQKNIGTYGENWIKMINPVSGRIHTQYKQLMNTGRLSSGGKNIATKESYPNFQNIPSDEETRSCFVAEEGNLLISCDYSAQESVVLVNQCLDPSLLEFYDKGLSDMHSFIASKMFKELNGLSLDEIKSKHKNKRQQSKVIGFALAYGGSAKAISKQLQLTEQEGVDIYNKYFEAFPDLDRYYTESKKFGVEHGYILLSPVTGKKCYVDHFDEFKIVEKQLKEKNFWEKYKQIKEHDTPTARDVKSKVSKYFSKKGDIERMSLNYKVQGESAEISKLAGIYFWRDYIVPNNLFYTVKIINAIHDEYLIECPENIIQEASSAIQVAMEKSASKFCKRVKLSAEPAHAKCWIK